MIIITNTVLTIITAVADEGGDSQLCCAAPFAACGSPTDESFEYDRRKFSHTKTAFLHQIFAFGLCTTIIFRPANMVFNDDDDSAEALKYVDDVSDNYNNAVLANIAQAALTDDTNDRPVEEPELDFERDFASIVATPFPQDNDENFVRRAESAPATTAGDSRTHDEAIKIDDSTETPADSAETPANDARMADDGSQKNAIIIEDDTETPVNDARTTTDGNQMPAPDGQKPIMIEDNTETPADDARKRTDSSKIPAPEGQKTADDDRTASDAAEIKPEQMEDTRALDENGNFIDDDDEKAADQTLATLAKEQEAEKIEMERNGNKMKTKTGSRGIVSIEPLKAKAQAWVRTLLLNEKTMTAVITIIKEFKYWDQQISSNNMVRKMRKKVEETGTMYTRLNGIPDYFNHWNDHYFKCQIIAIAAMTNSDGISIPHVFFSYRSGRDQISKDYIDMLSQIQEFLHWQKGKPTPRVRPSYIRNLASRWVNIKKKDPPKLTLPQLNRQRREQQDAFEEQREADLKAYKEKHGKSFNMDDVDEALENADEAGTDDDEGSVIEVEKNTTAKKRKIATVAAPAKTAKAAKKAKTTVASPAEKIEPLKIRDVHLKRQSLKDQPADFYDWLKETDEKRMNDMDFLEQELGGMEKRQRKTASGYTRKEAKSLHADLKKLGMEIRNQKAAAAEVMKCVAAAANKKTTVATPAKAQTAKEKTPGKPATTAGESTRIRTKSTTVASSAGDNGKAEDAGKDSSDHEEDDSEYIRELEQSHLEYLDELRKDPGSEEAAALCCEAAEESFIQSMRDYFGPKFENDFNTWQKDWEMKKTTMDKTTVAGPAKDTPKATENSKTTVADPAKDKPNPTGSKTTVAKKKTPEKLTTGTTRKSRNKPKPVENSPEDAGDASEDLDASGDERFKKKIEKGMQERVDSHWRFVDKVHELWGDGKEYIARKKEAQETLIKDIRENWFGDKDLHLTGFDDWLKAFEAEDAIRENSRDC